jgi:hypothetical protein
MWHALSLWLQCFEVALGSRVRSSCRGKAVGISPSVLALRGSFRPQVSSLWAVLGMSLTALCKATGSVPYPCSLGPSAHLSTLITHNGCYCWVVISHLLSAQWGKAMLWSGLSWDRTSCATVSAALHIVAICPRRHHFRADSHVVSSLAGCFSSPNSWSRGANLWFSLPYFSNWEKKVCGIQAAVLWCSGCPLQGHLQLHCIGAESFGDLEAFYCLLVCRDQGSFPIWL